jgi:hypothetical protein
MEIKALRIMSNKTKRDHVKNEDIRNLCKFQSMMTEWMYKK